MLQHAPLPLLVTLWSGAGNESIRRAVELVQENYPSYRAACEDSGTQLVLCGADEEEIEVICEHLRTEHAVEIGQLRVRYLRTMRAAVETEGKYIRQTGGQGNYGHCWLRIQPAERGSGVRFLNAVPETAIPSMFMPSIEQGTRTALAAGALSDFATTDVIATLIDGSCHAQDSNEMAFRCAAQEAVKNAYAIARFDLLEPIMHVAIECAQSSASWLIDDIRVRRGKFVGIEEKPLHHVIEATIPIAEVLRQSARGRPEYKLRFVGYNSIADEDDGISGVYDPVRTNPSGVPGAGSAGPNH